MDCLFCKIIEKQIPAKIIFEDENTLAFDDITPKAPVHKLIIPKKHIATLNDVRPEDLPFISNIFIIAQNIARESGIAEEGYRLVNNCNAGAGQTVFHLHFHLLGGRALSWPPG